MRIVYTRVRGKPSRRTKNHAAPRLDRHFRLGRPPPTLDRGIAPPARGTLARRLSCLHRDDPPRSRSAHRRRIVRMSASATGPPSSTPRRLLPSDPMSRMRETFAVATLIGRKGVVRRVPGPTHRGHRTRWSPRNTDRGVGLCRLQQHADVGYLLERQSTIYCRGCPPPPPPVLLRRSGRGRVTPRSAALPFRLFAIIAIRN